MKKILIPTDFSKSASLSLEVAYDIARRTRANLIILHVVEATSRESFKISGEGISAEDMGESEMYTYMLLKKNKKKLEKIIHNPRYKDVKIIGELRLGNPFHGINTIINEHKVDLVVMGTKGRTKLEEMIIGSNTEKVVRKCKRPVLTVHQKPKSLDFKNIVYATSMQKDEEVFSRMVRTTQKIYNSTVHLVRINTPGNFQRDVIIKNYMHNFAKSLQLKDYTVNVFNDLNEEEGIIYFSQQIQADLIAMATHGRTGFAHILSGSIAEEVISHAKRPVLTFVVKR